MLLKLNAPVPGKVSNYGRIIAKMGVLRSNFQY